MKLTPWGTKVLLSTLALALLIAGLIYFLWRHR